MGHHPLNETRLHLSTQPRFYYVFLGILIDFLISLITAHFAESVLEHYVLLEQVVYRHLALSVVVHRALEEEAQEALSAVATLAGSEVTL